MAVFNATIPLGRLGPKIVNLNPRSRGHPCNSADGTKVTVPAERVDVVDTVEAGDTFNAGVLAALSDCGMPEKTSLKAMHPETVEMALCYGSAAVITISRAGANPPRKRKINAIRGCR
ncbi:PfkB family carbohydrate kinase [Phaeobacter inhibens]|uniref:PfkB family carbohydrate kinase n=1 Tax=Phaeobacter inhibens TaxID=221822 RepID=UPI0030B8CEBD